MLIWEKAAWFREIVTESAQVFGLQGELGEELGGGSLWFPPGSWDYLGHPFLEEGTCKKGCGREQGSMLGRGSNETMKLGK